MKAKGSNVLMAAATLIILVSCQAGTKRLGVHEVEDFINDRNNGFIQIEELGVYTIGLKYVPSALVAIHQTDVDNIDEQVFDSLINEFNETLNFQLKLGRIDDKSLNDIVVDESGETLAYLMGSIQRQFFINDGETEMPCLFHHFERDYGISPDLNFSIVFNRSSDVKDITFIYDDELLNLGPIKFNIPIQSLDESYKLIF